MLGLARWWRRRSLRARLTLTAAAGLAVALAGLAVLLVTTLSLTLDHGLDGTARADRLVPLLPTTKAATLARSRTGVMLDGRPYGLPEMLRVVAVGGHRGETV